MFCGKCGFKNDDDAEFCAQCGEKIDISTDIRATLINENDISSKNKKVGKIVVFLMFVAVLIIVTSIVRSNNYRSVIKTYIKASFEPDTEKIVSLIPSGMIDYIIEDEDFSDKEEFMEEFDNLFQNKVKDINEYFGDHWKYSYEILDTKTIKKDDLDEIKKKYEEINVKVTAAKKVETKITVQAGDTRINSTTAMIYLIEIDGSWYLDLYSMNMSM
jgi:hypothetical protein